MERMLPAIILLSLTILLCKLYMPFLLFLDFGITYLRCSYGTGKTVSLDPKTSILVPEERYGLHAIDILDPDLVCVFFILPLFRA